MIPYGRQTIDAQDIAAVVRALKSDWLTQGPAIGRFESALARYAGVRHAVVFSHGTAALHGAYAAARLGPGDECVTTPLTFAATANAALYMGATPVFADIDPASGNLDPEEAERRITPKTRMISVVDYAGHPADMRRFRAIAKKHHLVLVEDACHSLGAEYKGTRVGGLADMSIFSFHPVKSITTGEGGAVLTDNRAFAERLRLFRTHGITKDPKQLVKKSPGEWYVEMRELGWNYRMTDMQAALGESQLKKLDRFVRARRSIAETYRSAFADCTDEIVLPEEELGIRSSWHLYVIRLRDASADRRARIFSALRSAGVGVQVHYIPVYLHPYYRTLGYRPGLCPKAEAYYASAISLPIFPRLTAADQRRVVRSVKRAIAEL